MNRDVVCLAPRRVSHNSRYLPTKMSWPPSIQQLSEHPHLLLEMVSRNLTDRGIEHFIETFDGTAAKVHASPAVVSVLSYDPESLKVDGGCGFPMPFGILLVDQSSSPTKRVDMFVAQCVLPRLRKSQRG